MDKFANVIQWISTPTIANILIYILIGYLILLWAAIVIWATKDIISRSNNILLQLFSILIVLILNIFGLIIYLAIRPSKTLVEKFFEELEYETLISETKIELKEEIKKKKRSRPKKKQSKKKIPQKSTKKTMKKPKAKPKTKPKKITKKTVKKPTKTSKKK